MLIFTTETLSPSSLEISSSAGAIIRHGPHHSAQKSTSTGPDAPSTSLAKLWSVTVFVAMGSVSWGIRSQSIWAAKAQSSTAEREDLRARRVKKRRLDVPIRENHRKRPP